MCQRLEMGSTLSIDTSSILYLHINPCLVTLLILFRRRILLLKISKASFVHSIFSTPVFDQFPLRWCAVGLHKSLSGHLVDGHKRSEKLYKIRQSIFKLLQRPQPHFPLSPLQTKIIPAMPNRSRSPPLLRLLFRTREKPT